MGAWKVLNIFDSLNPFRWPRMKRAQAGRSDPSRRPRSDPPHTPKIPLPALLGTNYKSVHWFFARGAERGQRRGSSRGHMTKQERQGWLIVGTLFVTLLLVFGGGYDSTGVFFPPLIKEFGWSRTQLSLMPAVLAASAGLSVPLAGWLLDRVEARVLVAAGAATAGCAFIAASRVHSFQPMVAVYLVLGLGITTATLLPASMVIANWFHKRRGLAMGIAIAGTSLGGAAMTMVANYTIGHGGWRTAYLVLGVPMIVIVIPPVLMLIRTRPPGAEKLSVAAQADALPGLEVRPALRSRSFWMITLAQFFYATAASGTVAHLISYLIGIGYGSTFAAGLMSTAFVCTSLGKITMGVVADRVTGRIALVVNFVIAAFGTLLLLAARNPVLLVASVVISGFTLGAPLVLAPLVMVDSLGLKRFGSLSGLSGLLNTFGAVVGPLAAGRMFDLTGSYTGALCLFSLVLLFGGASTLACRPLEEEQARAALVMRPVGASAAQ